MFQLDRNKDQISGLQDTKLKNEQLIFKLQNQTNQAVDEIEKFKQYQETLKGEYQLVISQKTSLQEEIQILTNANKNYERGQANLELKIKTLTEENFTKSETELTLNQKVSKLVSEIDSLRNKLTKLSTTHQNLKIETISKTSSITALKEEIAAMKLKINKLSDELDSSNKENGDLFTSVENWKSRYQALEMESKMIIADYLKEREQILDKQQQLESISQDRLNEIEQKSWENGKLLMRIAIVYSELDRVSSRTLDFKQKA